MDKTYMKRALRLAKKGFGKTSPNPMVGTVVVKGRRVVAEGYHRMSGDKHAEAVALEKAGRSAKGSTLYVNLEPCTHYGKTPPCVDRIISAGVRRVVVGMKDPNRLVSGKGIAKLKRAGLKVEVGLLRKEAQELNEVFIKYITTGRPFVIVKAAMSLDGKISTERGDSKWITGEKARRFVHKVRSGVDGVLVGINTVLKDDPRLTVRHVKPSNNPIRIVVDSKCRIPLKARLLSEKSSRVIIATARPCKKDKDLQKMGVEVLRVRGGSNGSIDLSQLLTELGNRNITSIMIEGGGEIIASAISSGIADKLLFFIAPRLIGGKDAPTPVEGKGINRLKDAIGVERMNIRRIGQDVLIEGYL